MMKRVTAAALAALLVLIAGCSGSKTSEPQQTPAPAPAPAPSTSAPELKTLSITLDGIKSREPELQAIANYLRQIGVQAEVRTWERAALNDEIKKGTRTAYTQDWGSSTFDPYDLAVPKLKTKDRGNFSFYSNPEVDKLLEEGAFGTTEAARRQAYERAQELLKQDAPWIFGYYMDVVEAARKDVVGFTPAMDGRINLHDVSRTGADSLVVGMRIDRVPSLDPANHRDREAETVIRNMYDGLVTRTPDGKVVPELAESWTQPDPKTYVFKLKQGVKFHDGSTMTADDVVFSFERTLSKNGVDGKQSVRAGLLGPVAKVEKTGDHEVKVTLERAFPVWLQLLVHTQVVSKAHVTAMGSSQKLSENPMGTGPFKFARGKLDGEIVLERFDDYYGGAAQQTPVGPAKLRQVTFRMIPEPATRMAALKAGEVHIVQEVPADQVAALKTDSNVVIKTTQGTRLYMIEINNQKITDPRVRQALNHAINWNEITGTIYGGMAHRVPTALLPSGFGFNASVQPFAYDPAKAKELLKAAGYQTK